MYCSMPKKRKLKLNKLNKISGLSGWEAKATERISVSIRWGWGGDGGPPGHQCVVRACGRHQEAEVRNAMTVTVLCFPEVFLWSRFLLLRSRRRHLLSGRWSRPRWAPPPRRAKDVPAAGRPSWPCSAPCGPAWSGTDTCRKSGPTL